MHNVREGNTVRPIICGHSCLDGHLFFAIWTLVWWINYIHHFFGTGPYLTNQESLKPYKSFYCTTQSDIHYYAGTTEQILIDEWRPSVEPCQRNCEDESRHFVFHRGTRCWNKNRGNEFTIGDIIYHTLHYNVKTKKLPCWATAMYAHLLFAIIFSAVSCNVPLFIYRWNSIFRSSTFCSCVSGQFKMDDNNGNTSSETHSWKIKTFEWDV